MILPGLFAARSEEARRTLVVVDETGVLRDRVAPRLEEGGFTIEPPEAARVPEDSLIQRVIDGDIGAYVVLSQETLDRGHIVYRGKQGLSMIRGLGLRQAVSQSALEVRLAGTGSEEGLSELLSGGELDVQILGAEEGGAGAGDAEFVVAFFGALMLYMVILLYGIAVMRAVLEEKTSRIVEILISTLKPWQLMLGKVLGVGSVGLTQLGIWVGIGVVAFMFGLPALMAARPELVDPQMLAQATPTIGLVAIFAALFFLGFFLYSALYAAVGAMCSAEEEVQQAQMPVTMLMVFSVVLLMPCVQDPTGMLATTLSLIPFFTPVLMFGRVAAGGVPAWQIAASLVLMVVAIGGVAWVAGRIYRVGILMQGKRPTFPELWRWIREE
jgi:ABC-2 type transport system permease protein